VWVGAGSVGSSPAGSVDVGAGHGTADVDAADFVTKACGCCCCSSENRRRMLLVTENRKMARHGAAISA